MNCKLSVCISYVNVHDPTVAVSATRGRYHGGRRPSSDESFHSPTRHSTLGARQTEYHEALTSSANVQSRLTSSFADDGNASWYSVCRVPIVG